MAIHIRPYRPCDLAAVLSIWDSATGQAYNFLDQGFLARERASIARDYIPHSEVWVAELMGETRGFIALQGIEVNGLFVALQFQHLGVGRALLEHALSLRGMLDLEVYSTNAAALAFYRAAGFEPLYEHLHEASGQLVQRLSLSPAP